MKKYVFVLMFLVGFVFVDLEIVWDLMEVGEFEVVCEMFLLLVWFGNVDVEELIGVMYVMGLGVECDDQWVFEWYLCSLFKGYSGV